MTMLDTIALLLGRCILGVAGIAAVAALLWLATDLLWKAVRISAFGADVIKCGLAAKRAEARKRAIDREHSA